MLFLVAATVGPFHIDEKKGAATTLEIHTNVLVEPRELTSALEDNPANRWVARAAKMTATRGQSLRVLVSTAEPPKGSMPNHVVEHLEDKDGLAWALHRGMWRVMMAPHKALTAEYAKQAGIDAATLDDALAIAFGQYVMDNDVTLAWDQDEYWLAKILWPGLKQALQNGESLVQVLERVPAQWKVAQDTRAKKLRKR